MRLVCISDTHTFHNQVQLPEGDVLIHAGDLTSGGSVGAIQAALDWLGEQPIKEVIVIGGNHDFALETRRRELHTGRLHYLNNESVEIGGVKFWGSPITPWFMNWAFMVSRGPEIGRVWDEIPLNTDVLITHGPPHGILDQAIYGATDHLGCEMLAAKFEGEIIEPKVHVFGHIHGGYGQLERYGTTFVNASQVNEEYRVANPPIVVDI